MQSGKLIAVHLQQYELNLAVDLLPARDFISVPEGILNGDNVTKTGLRSADIKLDRSSLSELEIPTFYNEHVLFASVV